MTSSKFNIQDVDQTSWTEVATAKDVTHLWICHNFVLGHPTPDVLKSPPFKDEMKFTWMLQLRSSSKNKIAPGLDLVCVSRGDNEHNNNSSIGNHNNEGNVTAGINFIDKNDEIFLPKGWKQLTDVCITRERDTVVLTVPFPFNLSDELDNLLHYGDLRVLLRIYRKSPIIKTGNRNRIEGKMPKPTLKPDLTALFENPTFSDVTICSGPFFFFPAHKAILAARSKVFRAMFEVPMKESTTSCVRLDKFSVEAVKGMLKYIYSDDLTVVTPHAAAEFFRIADFYNLKPLKLKAEIVLGRCLTLENAIDTFRMALIFKSEILQSTTTDFIVRNGIPVANNPVLEELGKIHFQEVLKLYKATLITPIRNSQQSE